MQKHKLPARVSATVCPAFLQQRTTRTSRTTTRTTRTTPRVLGVVMVVLGMVMVVMGMSGSGHGDDPGILKGNKIVEER